MLIQEDYFKNIFNTVREAILILDENMRVLSANRSFFTIFKVDAANTIGSLLYDLGNGQWNITDLRVLLEDILPKNDIVDDYEIEHNFESIGQKTMLLNARKIVGKNNELPIILLAIEDITARKEIEAGLEKTRKELAVTKISEDAAHEYSESVIDTVREPLLALDSDLRVVKANRSFYNSFKVTPQETIGNLIYDLGNRQWDIPSLRTLLEDILSQNNKFDDYEVEHIFSNIGHKIMLLNARRITHKEKGSQMILLAIEDITKFKKLERERKNILSMFAHDMKNPAVAAEGFLSRLVLGKMGALTEEQQSYLEIIQSELNKLSQLISDFLQFSRFEAIEYKPVQAPFNIEEEILKNIEAEKVEAEKKKIIIGLERLDTITPIVNADAAMVNRVIKNLLVNAIKYTGTGGAVTIKISDRDNEILVSVKDTGIGILKDHLPYIFDAFYRAGNSKGSGLGLSIAKAIIEGHGGRIWAESIPASGSTLSFTLPK